MTVTVQIETNTAVGLKLVTELRRYPDVVRFVEPDQISEPVPEGYVPLRDGFDEVRNHLLINSDTESLSANDSAKLAFDRLGEKYNRKFDNKYTR